MNTLRENPATTCAVAAPIHDGSKGERTRILLIEALALFRSSLGRMLSAEDDLDVVAECNSPSEALNLLKKGGDLAIDLILLDFDVGKGDANDFIRAARQAGYQGSFVIFVDSVDVRKIARALELGVSGVFLKAGQPQRLVSAIRTVMHGDVWVDQSVLRLLANQLIDRLPGSEPQLGDFLAPKERAVLVGIMQGLSNKRIGVSLGMSESAAKNIVQHLFKITGVRTRSQLVRMAFEGSLGKLAAAAKPVLAESTHSSSIEGTTAAH